MVELAQEIVEEREEAAVEEMAGETIAEQGESAENQQEPDALAETDVDPDVAGDEAVGEGVNDGDEGSDEDGEPGIRDLTQETRIVEALLFAATEPVSTDFLAERLPEGTDIGAILEDLQTVYASRGVNVARVAGKWALRTAEDLSPHLRIERKVSRKPSRAAVESLAIIAYHQPVTRSEVEEIRGVSVSKGSFDVLLEAGWIKPVGRRRTPGRPTTWGTTPVFLEEFGLDSLADLPGIDELKASGLLDTRPAGTIIGDTGEMYVGAEVAGAPEDDEPEALAEEDDGVAPVLNDESRDEESGDDEADQAALEAIAELEHEAEQDTSDAEEGEYEEEEATDDADYDPDPGSDTEPDHRQD